MSMCVCTFGSVGLAFRGGQLAQYIDMYSQSQHVAAMQKTSSDPPARVSQGAFGGRGKSRDVCLLV